MVLSDRDSLTREQATRVLAEAGRVCGRRRAADPADVTLITFLRVASHFGAQSSLKGVPNERTRRMEPLRAQEVKHIFDSSESVLTMRFDQWNTSREISTPFNGHSLGAAA